MRNCCTTGGCIYGTHAPKPMGYPHVFSVGPGQTMYVSPIYIQSGEGMHAQLKRLPLSLEPWGLPGVSR